MHVRKIFVTIIVLFLYISVSIAQKAYTLTEELYFEIDTVFCLVDKGYTLEQVVQDTTLHFKPVTSIKPNSANTCWIKINIINPFNYDVSYAVWAYPSFNNRLIYKNKNNNTWQNIAGGYINSNQTTVFNYLPCVLKSNETSTLYFKVGLQEFKRFTKAINLSLSFEKLELVQKKAKQKFLWWTITVSIILGFFLYNLYLFFMFKDKVYLYYLLILFGGIWYITGVNFYLSFFTSFKYVVVTLLPNGGYNYLPFDRAIMQLSTVNILTSFLLFTRSYLQTKTHLPFWHKVLGYTILIANIGLLGLFIPETLGIIPVLDLIPTVSNLISIMVIIVMLTAAIAAYHKKNKQAKYYLTAQILPLLLMLLLAIWLFVSSKQSWALTYLPNFALIAQTITFAVALVARVNLLKDDIHKKELRNKQTTIQLAYEQEKNQRLQDKIEHSKKELAAAEQIKLLMKELHHRVKNNLQIVSSLLSLQSFKIQDKMASDAVREGQQRIEAMSLIHQKLYTTENITEVNIKDYINDLIESLMMAYGFKKDNVEIDINVTDELMNVDKAIPVSLMINELATNIFKYAFVNTSNPRVTINLNKQDGEMILLVKDNGKGVDLSVWQSKDQLSFGKELVKTFTKQLDGTLTITNQSGTTFTIQFPL